jgi:hypothetical protein
VHATYLLNKRSEEFDNPPEPLLIQALIRRKQAEHVDKVVVHSVVLARELCEEHATHLPDLVIVVFDALGHFAQLALDLDLSGQDEECESHQTRALDLQALVTKAGVEEVGVLVNQVVEADGHVAERDDEVAAGVGVGRALHDGDEEAEVGLTVL